MNPSTPRSPSMPTWEPVPQTEHRPVSRWSEDNDTPVAGTHTFASYIPPYRLLDRIRELLVFGSRGGDGSGQNDNNDNKGTTREAFDSSLHRLRGWRTGIVLCILVCALVFALNAATAVLAILRVVQGGSGSGGDNDVQTDINNQVVTFYQGDCATARTFSLVLRLVVNILATVLLACANYCMQILVSPTRGEIDLVHRKKRWLWIGVPNLTNLPYVGLNRAAICLLLVVGTLPLHLLWNAALAETLSAKDYVQGSPSPSLSSSSCSLSALPILQYSVLAANALMLFCFVATWFAVRRGAKCESEERIVTNGDLIASYLREPDLRFAGRCLASARLVRKAKRQRSHRQKPRRRRRRASATTQGAQVDGSEGRIEEEREEEEDEEDTAVGFWNSAQPMPLPWDGRSRRRTTVLGSHERAGFTLEPGVNVPGSRRSRLGCFGQDPENEQAAAREERGRKSAPRWHTGVPHFLLGLLPAILLILAVLGLFFGFGLQSNLSLGDFGQPSPQTIAGLPAQWTENSWGAAATALVANTPQLAAVYIYATCNAALTAMLAHAEVSRFAVRRGGLRVSAPRPDTAQRSTLHLQLPLHVSLPLVMGSAALHWLVGESLFLLRVAEYGVVDGGSRPPPRAAALMAVGYSTIPILAAQGLLAVLVGAVLALGWFRRYMGAERMPLFATCSASLAAATCPTSSFFPQTLAAAGNGGGGGAKAEEAGETAAGTQPVAVQRRSRVGSWVEAVGLNTSALGGAVGLAHGHPSRDELGVISTPDPIAGSYAYYRVRRFEEKLSEHGLAWGIVDDSEPVHHATFSLGPVLPLEKGQFYA
ncbi:hypothetical protein PG993_000290 [Apiospora rasikravindrae]|uniref:DUF6536 domain-containing protein n=1 Tax=Apiospora rasikravindrae TaxID=990691 RepID=A0ABR1U825_9PEZI